MVGAGTLRAERLTLGVTPELAAARTRRGESSQPLQVIVSASGDVRAENILDGAPEDRVIFTSGVAEATRSVAAGHVRSIPEDGLRGVLELLSATYGVRRLLCEGGPGLNHALVSSGLVQELFVTLSPKLLGGDGLSLLRGPHLPDPGPSLRLFSAEEVHSELFLRYRFPGQEP